MKRGHFSALAGTALAISLVASGCALEDHAALQRVRLAYTDAASDPEVARHAPVALYEAERALHRAEAAWEKEGDDAEAEHLSYVAAKRVEMARLAAQEKQAEVEASQLGERRTEVLLEAREAELAALKARKTDRGVVIPVEDVLFAFDSAELKPEAAGHLFRLVNLLKEYPERELLIEGHTDSVGSDAYNLGLSQRRADSVYAFLTRGGISPARVATRGYGEAFPVASNATTVGRQENRRVEVVILHEGKSARRARWRGDPQ
jgi:outer membrane protein OmpA-like peptidoglycan-associated protein